MKSECCFAIVSSLESFFNSKVHGYNLALRDRNIKLLPRRDLISSSSYYAFLSEFTADLAKASVDLSLENLTQKLGY